MFYISTLAVFLVASVVIEIVFHEHLFHSIKERILFVLIFSAIGISWDIIAISNGHWVFLEGGTLGFKIGIIPIEEFLWFMIVPYFCLTVYRAVHTKFDQHKKWN